MNTTRFVAVTLLTASALLAIQEPSTSQEREDIDSVTPSQVSRQGSAEDSGAEPTPTPGQTLYSQHCAACHGENGNGVGRGARHVFPKPRDFRQAAYRLVSTKNRIASRDDLIGVLKRGIYGTAMPSFSKLSDKELNQIVDVLIEFRRDEAEKQLKKSRQRTGASWTDEELLAKVAQVVTPLAPISVPAASDPSEETLAEGRELFQKLNCVACHGKDGIGVLGVDLVDNKGQPTRAPSLVWEKLKSGREFNQIFYRIRLGLPGTPMPASPTLTDDQVTALTHFCLSVGKTPKRELTNFQRARLAIGSDPTKKE